MKFARNTLISITVLMVVAVGLGFGYTWYMGQQDNSEFTTVAVPEVKPKVSETKPIIQDPNAKVGVSVQSITSPANPGLNASIYIKTNPGATCKITVVYDKTASTDSGLKDKKADEYGMVDWTWTIEDSVPLGKWPVTVTCGLDEKRFAVVSGELVVEKPSKD